jgi:hypothetical protein
MRHRNTVSHCLGQTTHWASAPEPNASPPGPHERLLAALHLEGNDKTAFSMDQGLRKLMVTLLGPCNAPATFEWLIAAVLKRPHLRVMPRVRGRRERDWPHVPRAPVQPTKSVPFR